MNIRITTRVKGYYQTVLDRFDRSLFEALKPALAKMEIVEFTGSQVGDRVHIRFHAPIRAEWISKITEREITEQEAYFTDEGTQLPFPLTYWRHRHIVQKIDDDSSDIIDDITYRTSNPLLTALMYPAIYAGFYPRKKIYQEYFGV